MCAQADNTRRITLQTKSHKLWERLSDAGGTKWKGVWVTSWMHPCTHNGFVFIYNVTRAICSSAASEWIILHCVNETINQNWKWFLFIQTTMRAVGALGAMFVVVAIRGEKIRFLSFTQFTSDHFYIPFAQNWWSQCKYKTTKNSSSLNAFATVCFTVSISCNCLRSFSEHIALERSRVSPSGFA